MFRLPSGPPGPAEGPKPHPVDPIGRQYRQAEIPGVVVPLGYLGDEMGHGEPHQVQGEQVEEALALFPQQGGHGPQRQQPQKVVVPVASGDEQVEVGQHIAAISYR